MPNRGLLYGVCAYAMWGFFPLYWRVLKIVPASEILIHRIIWSFIFLIALLSLRKRWGWINDLAGEHKVQKFLLFAATLLAINWFIYIWAVNAGFVVETSLGYFITPLVNVFLGMVFLHEHLRPGQWIAISIVALAVMILAFGYGSFPWIALSLATSFGLYGLMKKKVHLGAAESLTAEMSLLLLPAIGFFMYLIATQKTQLLKGDPLIVIFLFGSGVVTAVPLIFFAAAARRMPLSMLGILQYIAPTLQFLIGVFIFKEPFTSQRLIGFILIWAALLTYSLEGVWQRRSHSGRAITKTFP